MTTNASQVIIEALNEATGEALQPLRLSKTDFLEVWMHENGSDLIARAVNCRPFGASSFASMGDGFLPPSQTKTVRPLVTETGLEVLATPYAPSPAATRFFAKLVERRHLGERSAARQGEWQITATDFNCLLIASAWPKERIAFRSDTARTTFKVAMGTFIAQNARAELQARFKIDGEVPALPPEFRDRKGLELAPYQRAALAFSLKSEGTALFMEQGTGKTAVTVARICTEARMHRKGLLGDEPRMMRVLVVCPKQVRINWQREIAKFTTVTGKVTILRGHKAKRMQLVTHAIRQEDDCAFSVVICNYDTARIDSEILEMIPWDLAVIDESHYIKRSSTKRGQALIKSIRDSADRRMALTGTPIANSIIDFYGQAEFLGHGYSGFATLSGFKKFHAKFDDRQQQKIVSYENIPLFQERLARISFRITKEEAGLHLPDKVYDLVEIEMSTSQTNLYNQIAESIQVEVQAGLEAGTMTVEHVLTRLLRLAQVTSGHYVIDPVYSEDGTLVRAKQVKTIADNPKLEALVTMLREQNEDDPRCKTLVFATFIHDVETIRDRLRDEGIRCEAYYGATSDNDRQRIVDEFNNDPELKVLVGNPTTMAEGLNLLGYNPDLPEDEQIDTNCGHVVFFSTNWSALERPQAEDRAHRRGTRMPVRITDLVVPDTIDEVIRQRVTSKRESADRLQDIKQILLDVLNLDLDLSTL